MHLYTQLWIYFLTAEETKIESEATSQSFSVFNPSYISFKIKN